MYPLPSLTITAHHWQINEKYCIVYYAAIIINHTPHASFFFFENLN
jgi:hypothetical protein